MTISRIAAEAIVARLTRPHPRIYGPNPTFNVAELVTRVQRTVLWCDRHADPGAPRTCLRPHELAPTTLPMSRWEAVGDVVRAREMRTHSVADAEFDAERVSDGQFLVYLPEGNTSCGGAEVSSDGFFNVDNAPPFGTWVAYFDDVDGDHSQDWERGGLLLAWIPKLMLPHAAAGIDANPDACIRWLDPYGLPERSVAAAVEAVIVYLDSVRWKAGPVAR